MVLSFAFFHSVKIQVKRKERVILTEESKKEQAPHILELGALNHIVVPDILPLDYSCRLSSYCILYIGNV